ncbi:MAG: hypothetical protein EP321_04950 [Sphingomonadales bacterium]|nr:MAG: hypothetical protein EP321_04950 [Sphingomonadales bacterium]
MKSVIRCWSDHHGDGSNASVIPMMVYRMNPRLLVPVLLSSLIIGCSPQSDKSGNTDSDLSVSIISNDQIPADETGSDEVDDSVPVDEGSMAGASGASTGSIAKNSRRIPGAMRGRWGLVAADCTSRHGDAKGLLEISGTTLTFYESRGTLRGVTQWAADHVRANFDFTGEGMNWRQDMSLTLKDGGKTLIRKDHGKDSIPGALRYRRCPA